MYLNQKINLKANISNSLFVESYVNKITKKTLLINRKKYLRNIPLKSRKIPPFTDVCVHKSDKRERERERQDR